MEPVTTKNIGDYRIKIYYDSNPGDPRADDNIAKMVCFHGRYKLGDEHDYNHNDYSGWEEMKNAIIKNEDVLYVEQPKKINTILKRENNQQVNIGFHFRSQQAKERLLISHPTMMI
jgi:hypothetical protein